MDDMTETAYTVRVISTSLDDEYNLSVTVQQIVQWNSTAYVAPHPRRRNSSIFSQKSLGIKKAYIFELPSFVTGGKCGYILAVQPYPEDAAYGGAIIYESTGRQHI